MPGLKRKVKRWPPNWAVGLRFIELKALSTLERIVAIGVDGSKIATLGPKSGVSEVGSVPTLLVVILYEEAMSLKPSVTRLGVSPFNTTELPPWLMSLNSCTL